MRYNDYSKSQSDLRTLLVDTIMSLPNSIGLKAQPTNSPWQTRRSYTGRATRCCRTKDGYGSSATVPDSKAAKAGLGSSGERKRVVLRLQAIEAKEAIERHAGR
jgi:hypothetical protein